MNQNEIVFYCSGTVSEFEVRIENETVWLNLNQLSLLFKRDKSVISRHISNVFKENELDKASTVAYFATAPIFLLFCRKHFKYLYISIDVDVIVYYQWNLKPVLMGEWYRCGGEQLQTDAECHWECL